MSTHDDDFWGDKADWQPATIRPRHDGARTGAFDAVRRGWKQLLSSGANPTREHGIVRPDLGRVLPDDREEVSAVGADMFDDLDVDYSYVDAPDRLPDDDAVADFATAEFATAEFATGADDTGWDAEFPTTSMAITDTDGPRRPRGPRSPTASSGAVDPLLARIGALAIVTVLLIPLAVSFGSSGGDDLLESAVAAESITPSSALLPQAPAVANPTTSAETPSGETSAVPTAPPAPAVDANAPVVAPDPPSTTAAPAIEASEATESVDQAQQATATGVAEVAAAAATDSPAERVARVCAVDYEVVAGDFWIRIADGAGVPLAELLEANGVSASTPIYPGMEICLPAGSTIPPPPATTTTTTVAPTTTQATTTTTEATTTTTTSTVPASSGDVQQIIRDVWPDELEDYALEIAYRESRYVPTAKNFCCYGIFQIYWNVHRSWLADLGITSDQQLYDPRTNTEAAYALYLRAGGWGPWGG